MPKLLDMKLGGGMQCGSGKNLFSFCADPDQRVDSGFIFHEHSEMGGSTLSLNSQGNI